MPAKINPFTSKLDLVNKEYFVENGNVLELWWNGTMVQSWTVTPAVVDTTGQPMGLLLTLTYAS